MIVGISVTVHLVHLWLNLFPFPIFAHVSSIDLIIKVADIAHDAPGLSARSIAALHTSTLPVAEQSRSV